MKRHKGEAVEFRYHMTPHRRLEGSRLIKTDNTCTAGDIPGPERIKTRRRPGTTEFVVVKPRRKQTRTQIRANGGSKKQKQAASKKKKG